MRGKMSFGERVIGRCDLRKGKVAAKSTGGRVLSCEAEAKITGAVEGPRETLMFRDGH